MDFPFAYCDYIMFPLLSVVCCQADVPTAIGVGPPTEVAMEMEGGTVSQLEKKYYIDSTYITVPREGVEINTPLRDGLGEYSTYITVPREGVEINTPLRDGLGGSGENT